MNVFLYTHVISIDKRLYSLDMIFERGLRDWGGSVKKKGFYEAQLMFKKTSAFRDVDLWIFDIQVYRDF